MTSEERDEKQLAEILERNPHLREPIHPWRWRALTLWIILFTVLMFWAVRVNRSAIAELERAKASIAQLEKTNCGLKQFLLAAAQTRYSLAQSAKDPVVKQQNLDAYHAYVRLAATFRAVDGCRTKGLGG